MQPRTSRAIVLVDDEPDIVDTLAKPLRRSGFRVQSFTDPLSALEHFKKNALDFGLLISDVRMPGMSGFELAEAAKRIKADLRIIMMTGFEINKITVDKLRDAISFEYLLTKPILPSKMVELARQLLPRQT